MLKVAILVVLGLREFLKLVLCYMFISNVFVYVNGRGIVLLNKVFYDYTDFMPCVCIVALLSDEV